MLSDQDLIEKYLRGELTVDDYTQMQSRMQFSEFNQLLQEANKIRAALEYEDALKLKKLLQKEESKFQEKNGIKLKNKLALLFICLTLLGLLVYLLRYSPDNKDKLYAQYFTPYPNVVDPITKSDASDISLYKQYESKNYIKVITQLLTQNDLSDQELFYLANSYMAIDKLEDASRILNSMPADTKYSDQIRWYKALICLRISESNCNSNFMTIQNDISSFYNDKAVKIIKSLKAEIE